MTDYSGTQSGKTNVYDLKRFAESVGKMPVKENKNAAQKFTPAWSLGKKREEAERQRRAQREAETEAVRREAHIQEVTCMDLPMDWENIFNSDSRTRGVHTDSIPDALIMSLTTLGCVDIEYISSVTGEDYKTVITTLKGSIYQNPLTWDECFFRGWETAEEYLSGNLKRKWAAAKNADEKYHGYFTDNLRAIEKVLPPAVTAKSIYITPGSPWVPPDIIDDFIFDLFGDPVPRYFCGDREKFMAGLRTIHDELTGSWEIPRKSRYGRRVLVTRTYGTDRMEALDILEKTLNMKTVTVTDEVSCPTAKSGVKRVVNKAETIAAVEKQQKLIQAFQDWVWRDDARRLRLERIYGDRFGCVRKRCFDGSFLTFPTMSPDISLRDYQKNAVARILFSPNTLLAHDVGAGKTYVMIAAGQELRRMGLSEKNLYVVPNNITGEWKSIFLSMYPDAKLLCIEPKSFTPEKREHMLCRVRDEEFDGIIIAYSCFEQIPLSKNYYVEELESKQKLVANQARQKSKATARLKKKHESINKALSELTAAADDTRDTVCFDELGITRLFVDEAHNFKNVPIETKAERVLGISSTGSKRCRDMMDKVHLIQKNNGGKGVVFATGTPITNSVTDAYIMQQYLQSGELAMLDLQSFDAWIGMFAERSTEFEIDVDTSSYRLATRFSRFHNLPELTALLASVADFHRMDSSAGVPEHDGYQDALIAKTPEFSDYLGCISRRADDVRQNRVSKSDDNMLKITTDGRKAALDLRLVDPGFGFNCQSKVARCAENAAEIYFRTGRERSTQLIFCDTSTPKDGFNIYDELKRLLTEKGVPEAQIAYIHDAATETKRTALFAKLRRGDVRILIGSTFKLGMGINIQDRLIALHHIDVPWRPADMTQREGRILRQGNMNPKVRIFRYITEGSFDAYSWQLLETKQRFISALLSGSLTERDASDIKDTVLNYAEVKALAVDNPLVRQRVETANELERCLTLQRKFVDAKIQMEQTLSELPGRIGHQRELIRKCEEDIAAYALWKETHPPKTDVPGKQEEAERRKLLREYITASVQRYLSETKEQTLIYYRGFSVVLPANMIPEKPYVWLTRQGRYYVELGENDVGNLIRIDNFLDGFGAHLEKMKAGLSRLTEQEREIRAELAKNDSYSEMIAACRVRIKELDEELEVEKK